ncbi:unconventional myosin-XVIIIa-like [Cotesia typhae]|uniref:unconventional myosin-XVIIIa-like n=1 Tax=Cotesia typhae TaxID=2053667 RepID=UPI003D694B3F
MKLPKNDNGVINVLLLCSQIRGGQIIDAMRLHKVGFLKYLPLCKFRRRFGLLFNDYAATVRSSSPVEDERRVVTDMLLTMDVDAASFRVGQSQIFFRAGALERIEAQRDEKLTSPIVLLQARCKGYLARKNLIH